MQWKESVLFILHKKLLRNYFPSRKEFEKCQFNSCFIAGCQGLLIAAPLKFAISVRELCRSKETRIWLVKTYNVLRNEFANGNRRFLHDFTLKFLRKVKKNDVTIKKHIEIAITTLRCNLFGYYVVKFSLTLQCSGEVLSFLQWLLVQLRYHILVLLTWCLNFPSSSLHFYYIVFSLLTLYYVVLSFQLDFVFVTSVTLLYSVTSYYLPGNLSICIAFYWVQHFIVGCVRVCLCM